ncbi:protein kinase 6 [Chrysochromulina tobinii]|uniref:non-specific serine/threonine protein kinase n=1 Tax=Chrysochromulina tobinii TaxID=1460289 RepID=A0A0M0JFW8_9EUKA|nr:protein kinase 6 [Chrysochromulina tobinii]|eukprot:KOO25476.1 protein kinase 6 [Chrysochromulina sp. CCMP291]
MALTEPVSAAATVESSLAAATAGISAASSGSLADYVIEKAIGRGHFSTVHRAVRRSDERRVALKKVQIFDMLDAKARDRCLKEVDLLKTLKPHPCIIQYIDSFIDNSELYIVFEWAEHGDLRRLLRRANESKTSLQEVQVWRYFVQVCDGIRHMHEARIMHRDIKPANIFLASNGSVKLGDLGLGRAFSSQTYEALSKVGTPLYMSPEVLDGRGYEWKSDVWSLGCLLYELATLRSPFKAEGDNLYTLFKKISVGKYEALPAHYSPALQSLVQHMIQLDPTRRLDIHATLDLPPLPCAYFTGAPVEAAEAAQLEYLYTLTCWLLQVSVAPGHELWKLVPTASSATYDADAGAACAALLHTLSKAPAPLGSLGAMPPHRLRAARGAEAEADAAAATRDAASEAVANKQQRVDALSSELMNLEDEISRTKAQAAGRGVELSGSQPLDQIRAALRALRLEVKALVVREAMASKTLATRRRAEERAARTRSARGCQESCGCGR